MALRDDGAYVGEAVYAGQLPLDEFLLNEKTQNAVVRQIEIVGGTCGKVSPTLRSAHPEIPWTKIVGMRNHLIHGGRPRHRHGGCLGQRSASAW